MCCISKPFFAHFNRDQNTLFRSNILHCEKKHYNKEEQQYRTSKNSNKKKKLGHLQLIPFKNKKKGTEKIPERLR
jgi:hypothetical protein